MLNERRCIYWLEQILDQWWVDTMKIFHRNIHTLFGRYQDETKIRSRWHDRPESTGIVCGLNHWPFHGSYSWGMYFVWCSWLKLYHHSLGILPAQGSYSSGTYGVVLVYNYITITYTSSYFYRTRVRSLHMLVTNWLTHSVTFSKLDWCDPDV